MYAFTKALAGLLSQLSFASLERMAQVLAWVMFDLCRFRRRLMLQNLDYAFPDRYTKQQKIAIARASYSHFLQTIFEVLIFKKHRIDANVEVMGGEFLTKALAEENGVYILAGHMGNWEAMASVVSKRFRPTYTVVKKVGSTGLNRFVEEHRMANSIYWITRKKKGDAVKQMVSILQKGNIVGFIMDQARPGEPRLPFFSQAAKTNTSLAAIWQKHPAPIITAYMYRKSFGHHVLTIRAPLQMQVTDDKAADILDNSAYFNRQIEVNVSAHPEHYFWFHNRWK